MSDYRPPTFSLFPLVVKNLLIANSLLFFVTYVLGSTYHIDLNNLLGLHYIRSSEFKPYQLVTYMFMHGNIPHILFNMFALWMFGYTLENFWGSKKFLVFYFVCGIGAGITQEVVQYFYFHHIQHVLEVFSNAPNETDFTAISSKYFGIQVSGTESHPGEYLEFLQKALQEPINNSITLGASGAIFGILLAFGMLFPNMELLVYFIIPVKAKYFVIVYGLLELFFAVSNRPGDNVAHYAHLGGMVFGFFLLMYWRRRRI